MGGTPPIAKPVTAHEISLWASDAFSRILADALLVHVVLAPLVRNQDRLPFAAHKDH